MAAKRSQGKLLTLAVQTECIMQMVIEQVLPFLVFLLEKKFDKFGKIGCPERQRRGFVITNATRVCNVHFQQSDIVRVPGGSRLHLKIGALPLKWNQRPAEEQRKRKAPKNRSQPSNILYESAESGSVKSYAKTLACTITLNI